MLGLLSVRIDKNLKDGGQHIVRLYLKNYGFAHMYWYELFSLFWCAELQKFVQALQMHPVNLDILETLHSMSF